MPHTRVVSAPSTAGRSPDEVEVPHRVNRWPAMLRSTASLSPRCAGYLASAAWLVAAVIGATRFAFDWRLTALLFALGGSGLVVLSLYRTRILEH